jgi:hypothetical protein
MESERPESAETDPKLIDPLIWLALEIGQDQVNHLVLRAAGGDAWARSELIGHVQRFVEDVPGAARLLEEAGLVGYQFALRDHQTGHNVPRPEVDLTGRTPREPGRPASTRTVAESITSLALGQPPTGRSLLGGRLREQLRPVQQQLKELIQAWRSKRIPHWHEGWPDGMRHFLPFKWVPLRERFQEPVSFGSIEVHYPVPTRQPDFVATNDRGVIDRGAVFLESATVRFWNAVISDIPAALAAYEFLGHQMNCDAEQVRRACGTGTPVSAETDGKRWMFEGPGLRVLVLARADHGPHVPTRILEGIEPILREAKGFEPIAPGEAGERLGKAAGEGWKVESHSDLPVIWVVQN